MKRFRQAVIFLIPLLYLIWSLQINLSGGSFSLTRSDPEYPYLLNGLNCATLHFNNIGHTDHPGTPFQVSTGLFIRVTHFCIGQGSISQDVLSRPETYLSAASLLLSLLTLFLLYWLGRIGLKTSGKFTGALILQSTFLLSTVLVDMPHRYNPDRILIMYNLLLAGFTLKYLFTEGYPVRRFAIISGIIMGIGFATKFNFLPVLVLPFLIIPDIRNKLIYGASVAVSFFIGVLPILNKFKEFRRFISGVASHDGLYGQGTPQMINWRSFVHNFGELLSNNPAYTIILILTVGISVAYLLKKEKFQTDQRLIRLLQAFLLASIIGFVLVSKHFKVYYFAPVLSLSGLVLFTILKISEYPVKSKKAQSLGGPILLALFVIVSLIPVPSRYRSRISDLQASLKTSQFYTDHVTRKDLLFIEPTWMAGPMTENALVYGISYVAHRQQFYQIYNQLYPNVITYEGPDKNPGLFRTAQADPESILYGGRDIYVYSSPGRNAGLLLTYLDTLAVRFGTGLVKDTVFSNPVNSDQVIRVRNRDNWSTLTDIQELAKPAVLQTGSPVSPEITISDVKPGDYLEITLRIFKNDSDNKCRLIAKSVQSAVDGIYFEDSGSLQDIGYGWQLLRLRGKINSAPADGKMICQAYYPGNKKITVQDQHIRLMGRR